MSKNLPRKTNWRALRLTLLWVLGGIIVFAYFLPDPKSRTRPAIQRSVTQIRGLAQGAVVFAVDNGERLPTEEEWPRTLIELNIIEPDMLISPLDHGTENAYIYVPSQKGVYEPGFEKRIVLYENPDHYEEGVVVGYAGAWAEILDHEDFERILAEQLATDNENRGGELP